MVDGMSGEAREATESVVQAGRQSFNRNTDVEGSWGLHHCSKDQGRGDWGSMEVTM